jgi:hypothetical protein
MYSFLLGKIQLPFTMTPLLQETAALPRFEVLCVKVFEL